MTGPDVWTATEAAARLGVTAMTLKRWAKTGRMEAIRGQPWLFSGAEVDRMAAELAEELTARVARMNEAAS